MVLSHRRLMAVASNPHRAARSYSCVNIDRYEWLSLALVLLP